MLRDVLLHKIGWTSYFCFFNLLRETFHNFEMYKYSKNNFWCILCNNNLMTNQILSEFEIQRHILFFHEKI